MQNFYADFISDVLFWKSYPPPAQKKEVIFQKLLPNSRNTLTFLPFNGLKLFPFSSTVSNQQKIRSFFDTFIQIFRTKSLKVI